MNASVACQACRNPFIPDLRHLRHQPFCLCNQCQKARHRQNQTPRRARARPPVIPSRAAHQVHHGWLSDKAAMMKPYDAVLSQFHPAVISLVSQFIDSPRADDIVAFLRRCIARGQDILVPAGMTSMPKGIPPQRNSKIPRVRRSRAA